MRKRNGYKMVAVSAGSIVIITLIFFATSCGGEEFYNRYEEGDNLGDHLLGDVSGMDVPDLPEVPVVPPAAPSGIIDNSSEYLWKVADYVVRARILRVTSKRERYDDNAELVMSRIRLEILKNLKGHLKTGVEIRSFGGVLDDLPYFAAEFPRFEKGEEVILFLKKFDGGIFPVQHARGVVKVKEGTSL